MARLSTATLAVCLVVALAVGDECATGGSACGVGDGSANSLLQTGTKTHEAKVHTQPTITKLKFGQDVNYPPYAYEENEQPTGFGADIARGVSEVCDDVEIEVVKCKWSDCWQPHGLGKGLSDGTLHACMTYTHTRGLRNDFADFSYGILDVNKAAGLLTTLDGGKPAVTGHDDLSGKTVVDVAGWAPTADGLGFVENKCTGTNYAGDYILKMADGASNNNDKALSMLLGGEADAMFVYSDQAANYKKACKDPAYTEAQCDKWSGFGTKFAYVQTGQFGYVHNGTTLALTKKGSGVAEKVNPCLAKFMETEDYYKICEKYGFVDSCYRNQFFPGGDQIKIKEYNKPTDKHEGDCTSGYCPCT